MRHLTKIKRMNRGKRILLSFVNALVFEGAAQAKFNGFYAGGSLGYLNQTTSLDAKQNPANPNADIYSATTGRGLPTAELFLGWGKVFGTCFYGGVEGKIDWVPGGSQKVAEDTNFIYRSGRKSPGVAALARLGYLITPTTLIYGGVGVKGVRFAYNLFEKTDKISASFSRRSLNLLTEMGVETCPSALQNVAFRFSYSFMPKRNMTRKAAQFPLNHMYRGHGVFKAGTAEHAFKVGMVYRF